MRSASSAYAACALFCRMENCVKQSRFKMETALEEGVRVCISEIKRKNLDKNTHKSYILRKRNVDR